MKKMEVISTWTNPEYPGKTMKIVRHPKYGVSIHDGGGILNTMPETFIGYENLLYANGWRKQP